MDSLGYIASNVAANMMGLGSAATPFGLKAMKELQKINDKKLILKKTKYNLPFFKPPNYFFPPR